MLIFVHNLICIKMDNQQLYNLTRKYYINCYSYKIWSPTTIQKWSKLQEELKRTPRTISNKMLGVLLNKIVLEDIV